VSGQRFRREPISALNRHAIFENLTTFQCSGLRADEWLGSEGQSQRAHSFKKH
jgi:hypothetical protein